MMKTCVSGANRLLPIVLAAILLQSQWASAAGCDVPMFAGGRLFATSTTGAQMLATGDFNRDGITDLAVVNSAATISILLGNGDGGFQPAVSYPVARPLAIAVADFNGDGNPDLAVADSSTNGILVLPGKGDGTFGAAIKAFAGQTTGAMAVGDFNGDGKPDLAISGTPAYLLLGKGDGTFQTLVQPAGGALFAGFSVAAGDFNGDGKLDVIAGSTDGFFLLLGEGNGNLAAPVDFSAGSTFTQVAVADVNGDRKLDVVGISGTGNSVSVVLGNGNGTFQAATTYTAGNLPTGVAIADFNGDGKPDLAVANHTSLFPTISGTISVYLGNGDGTFQPPVQYNPTAQANSWLVAADFNGDGKLDLAFSSITPAAPTQVGVMLANADGTMQSPNSYATGQIPRSPVLADLNGDGIADLVVANAGFSSGGLSVMLGNGDGSFQTAVNYPTSLGAKSVAVGDVNGDGKPDLVVGNFSAGNLLVFLGNGDGSFQASRSVGVPIGAGSDVALGDFNNDGKLDVAVQGFGVSILLGNGDGTFRGAGTYGPSSFNADKGPIAIADLNGDGNLDIVLPASNNDGMGPLLSPGIVSVLLGNGNGTFRPNVDYKIGTAATSVAIGDLNADGKPDLVVSDFANTLTNKTGALAVLLGNGDGTFQNPVRYAVSATGAVAVVMSDFNGDGNVDVASLSPGDQTVTVLLGDGDGAFRDPLVYGAGTNPLAMAVGDMNGDGKPDLLFVDDVANTVVALLNNYVPGGASPCGTVSPLGN